MLATDEVALRQCVLAVSVMSDIDLTPGTSGVLLAGEPGVVVSWADLAEAVAAGGPYEESTRRRVATLLRLRRLVADLGPDAGRRLHEAARVMALPPGHVDHPGLSWTREPLRGNALDLGIGLHGLLGEPDRSTPVPASVLHAIDADPAVWWPALGEHADRMGALAAARLLRGSQSGVIRPVGGLDVLALLSSRTLRRQLADTDSVGMRALAVPTRRRGWFDLSQIDPAFVLTAWNLTDEHERGLPGPVLVTRDEVFIPEPRNRP